MKPISRWLLPALIVVLVGAGMFWWFRGTSDQRGTLETLGEYGEVPDFTLIERSGRKATRTDLLGKVWVANFIYTQCNETCPLQTARMAQLQTEFVNQENLRLVSISVDPERDTPEVLSRYAKQYGAHPVRWLFLTGEKRVIYQLAKEGFRLGVVDPDDQAQAARLLRMIEPAPAFATHGSKGLVIHSSRFVLVDRKVMIRAYHLPDDEESLKRLRKNVRTVLGDSAKEK